MGIPNLSKADEGGPHTFYHILNEHYFQKS